MIKPAFEWPAPPYFNFVLDDQTKAAHSSSVESCLVYYNNGDKVVGKLTEFSLDESIVAIQPKDSDISEPLNLQQIKSIQLLQPHQLERDQGFLEVRSGELLPALERQTYSVEFTDNELIVGYTIGHISTDYGLYIYPVTKNEKVVPCFIPRHSIKSYKVGQLIGEILLEEKLASKEDIEVALKQQTDLRTQRIGDYLSENQIISIEQLTQAIQYQEKQPILKLGEALLQLELLTQDQLGEALEKQKENRQTPLGQILLQMGVIDERTLKGAMAKKLSIPYVSLTQFNFDLNAIKLVNAALAKKEMLIPLCVYEGSLVVALENPMNTRAIEELRFTTQMKVLPAMASREDIQTAIIGCYGEAGGSGNRETAYDFDLPDVNELGINDLATRLFTEDSDREQLIEEKPVTESDNTLVQLVNKMILDAYRDGVSDIHIETYPDKKNTRVRFRKDGSLVAYLEIPSNFRNALISRIKIMSQLDISERRKPQDGKLDFKQFGPANVELRVATIPTAAGLEDVVMRVLAAAKPVPVDKLGIDADKLAVLKKLISQPYGLILVCGPTGSGKTTTLHSLLGHINTPDRKIWTAEDPVEITQAGLRQVQVNAKIGWTFAGAMRSFLRADPDVIMVGEMRDQETTKIGIEASLTGHLVLSTLHTNSAPESIVRMLDLGMDPFNFADALLAILAQRLAKTLCPKCKEAYTPEASEIEELALEYIEGTRWNKDDIIEEWSNTHKKDGKFTLYHSKGCKACNDTGYKGRLGLYEFMTINPTLKHLIQTRAPVTELVHEALEGGMRTLKQDGIGKVLQGATDIVQVRAVCV
ncbi:MAG TPA: ATPase, T2SS/T4P/T4SS family [Methylophilaceae bacterium]|nr:ATPase, T2SS/T4P/T4SS family [Methylophilaceae bacterium]